jgi:CxxC motif-containing protein (DUF1111 family)
MTYAKNLSFLAIGLVLIAACGDEPAASVAAPPSRDVPGVQLSRSAGEDEESTAADVPLERLTPAELARFEAGEEIFDRAFTPAEGLGPLFNASSCAECHENEETGGVNSQLEVHVGNAGPNGSCDLLDQKGGPVIQQFTTPALHQATGLTKEPVPPGARAVSLRTVTATFGFGFLENVPDFILRALADPFDRNHDGISGRLHILPDGRIGRFGRKAVAATLREFNADAFLNEMGITSSLGKNEQLPGGNPLPPGVDPIAGLELSDRDLDLTTDYLRFLRPPRPLAPTRESLYGNRLFLQIGCAGCHIPSLPTGYSPVAALRFKLVNAYTDLLLHNLGPGLADVCRPGAGPEQYRTEPLMGLRLQTHFLHNGSAATIEQAVLAHGGEASRSRQRFQSLSRTERQAVLAFLSKL